MYGDTVTYALSPQKKINFTIAIVFRVLLDISQSPKSSLNMMEIQHLTM